MNFPFVPPASNAATLRWKNWIAIHFLITGVAVLTLSGFSSVMGIWVLEDYGLTLSAPGWELMRGAKVVGEILSGLGLVLFIISIWTGKPRTKPGLWLSCLLALWLAVTVPGPGFEPVIDAGLPVPVWCALTSLAILVFTLRVATGSRQALSVAIGTAAVLGALSAENLAPVLLGILFILLGRTRSALLAREELLFTLANPDRETLTGFVLQGVGYGIVVLGAAAWYSYSAYSNEHFSVSLLIQGIVIFLIGAVLLLIRPGKKSEAK